MGILDWFKSRSSYPDQDQQADELTQRALDKAVSLVNPRLKLLDSCQERLAPAISTSIGYFREAILAMPPAVRISAADWANEPLLRVCFVAAADIPLALARSQNLRTLFNKFPDLDEAYFILGMNLCDQRILGMSLQGNVVQREVEQRVIAFSRHMARICGKNASEVWRLLGAQLFEYLVAQAITKIGEDRSDRRELEDNRALIRARLRLLQQQGPGLGSVFTPAPSSIATQQRLEAELLENERQLEALGDSQELLEDELDVLCEVMSQPERYLSLEQQRLRLSTMNVVVDEESTDVAFDVEFSRAHLLGEPQKERAFVLARIERGEMPVQKLDIDNAARYL